jgi:hypothetical protein
LTEGEAVVVYWEEGFVGGHFVYLEFDSVECVVFGDEMMGWGAVK